MTESKLDLLQETLNFLIVRASATNGYINMISDDNGTAIEAFFPVAHELSRKQTYAKFLENPSGEGK